MAHHRAVTLAASCWAIFTAESAGSALHVLTSMMMLFLCASARPQPGIRDRVVVGDSALPIVLAHPTIETTFLITINRGRAAELFRRFE